MRESRDDRKNGFLILFLTALITLILLFATGYILWYLFMHFKTPSKPISAPTQSAPAVYPATDFMPKLPEGVAIEAMPAEEAQKQAVEPEPAPAPAVATAEEEPETVPVTEEVERQPEDEPIMIAPVDIPSSAPAEVMEESFFTEKSFGVPDAPLLMDPWTELGDGNFFAGPDTPTYDDDFFKNFFVQGVDKLSIDDGFYYFTVFVDDERLGNVEVRFEGDERAFNAEEIRNLIGRTLTDSAYKRFLEYGDAYIPVSHFTDNGAEVRLDEDNFQAFMKFSLQDMPVKIISLSQSYSGGTKYSLTSAEELKKNFFSLATGWSLYASYDWKPSTDYFYWYISLNSNNYANFGDVNLDFYYSMMYTEDGFDFSFNSYRFFKDFDDEKIRLSWGNVYGYGLSPSGTSLGVQFEKYEKAKSGIDYEETVTVTEASHILVKSNSRTYIDRNINPGNYLLRDFTFESGRNTYYIYITPLSVYYDGMPDEELERNSQVITFDQAYDTQLMRKGDTTYGGSLIFGRTKVDERDKDDLQGLSVMLEPGIYYDYRFDDMSLSWWQDVGLLDALTMNSTFSLATHPKTSSAKKYVSATADFSFTNANYLGTTILTTDFTLNGSSEFRHDGTYGSFGFYGRLDHRFLMSGRLLSSLSVSLAYSNAAQISSKNNNEITGSVSMGGMLGFLRYSFSGSSSLRTLNPDRFNWRFNGSVSFSPMRGMSVSSSISAYQGYEGKAQIVGYLSISYSWGKGSVSYSSDYFKSNNMSISLPLGSRDYFSASVSNVTREDPLNHNLSASYSHTGTNYSMSLRGNAYDTYKRYGATFAASTATFYTGGIFGVARGTSENFLLIRPVGSLRGGTVQVARSSMGNAQVMPKAFGTATYTALGAKSRNNLVAYVSGKDEFADTQSFAYEINTGVRGGYSIKAKLPDEFTVSGILYSGGEKLLGYSSPVYRLDIDKESGKYVLSQVENLYIFTDQDGRYILSGVTAGTYVFDVPAGNSWYAAVFTVRPATDDILRVVVMNDIDLTSEKDGLVVFDHDLDGNLVGTYDDIEYMDAIADYDGTISLTEERLIDSASFWNELFPPFEDDWSFYDDNADDFYVDEGESFEEEGDSSATTEEAPTEEQSALAAERPEGVDQGTVIAKATPNY